MSVQLLSARESSPIPDNLPGIDNDKLDSVISAAIEKHTPPEDSAPAEASSEAPKSEKKFDLDQHLTQHIERWDAVRLEKESFDKSRPAREELNRRYASQGANTKETIGRVLDLAKQFRANPYIAGETLIRSYITASPWESAKTEEPKKAAPDFHPNDWKTADTRRTNDKIDSLIADAFNAGREKEDFEATAEQRKQLAEFFPGKSFDQIMSEIVAFDDAARKDPAAAAHRLAAMAGLPYTDMQRAERQAFAANVGSAQRTIAQTAPHLPGFNRERLLKIVSDPRFPSTGNHQTDLINAHRIDQAEQQLQRSTEALVDARSQAVSPELYAEIESVVTSQHPSYVAAFRDNDPVHNWGVAEAIARARLSALAKAKKAGRIRSSPSAGSSDNSDKSLDSIISAAISKHL